MSPRTAGLLAGLGLLAACGDEAGPGDPEADAAANAPVPDTATDPGDAGDAAPDAEPGPLRFTGLHFAVDVEDESTRAAVALALPPDPRVTAGGAAPAGAAPYTAGRDIYIDAGNMGDIIAAPDRLSLSEVAALPPAERAGFADDVLGALAALQDATTGALQATGACAAADPADPAPLAACRPNAAPGCTRSSPTAWPSTGSG